jgi:hypothetical protein
MAGWLASVPAKLAAQYLNPGLGGPNIYARPLAR